MANLLKIKSIAEEKNIPLKDVAEYIGITQTGLSKIIRENSTKTTTLEKIALKLKVSVSTFFDDDTYLVNEPEANLHPLEPCSKCEALEKEVSHLKALLEAKEEIISLLRGATGEGKGRQVS